MSYFIYILMSFTIAIPALAGMAFFKRLTKPARIIAILMVAGLFTEISLFITAHIGTGHFYVVDVYSFAEVVLLTFFFSQIVTGPRAENVIKLIGVTVCIAIVAEVLWGGLEGWSSLSTALESVFIITTGFYYCYQVARGISLDSTRSTNFWFIVILMFYFMSSLEYFLLNRFLINASRSDLMMLGIIHTFVNAFCNVAYGFILWKSTRSYSLAR